MLRKGFADAKTAVIGCGYRIFSLLYWEILLHFAVFGELTARFWYAVGFTVTIALALELIVSFLPKRANFAVNVIIDIGAIALYGSQMVYYFIFGTLYSVSQMGQGGAAITSFWRETLATMLDKLPWLVCLLVPIAVLFVLRRFFREAFAPSAWGWRILAFAVALLLFFGTQYAVEAAGTGRFSDYYYYHCSDIVTDSMAQRFGLLTTMRLEMFGDDASADESVYYIPQPTQEPSVQPTQQSQGEDETESLQPEKIVYDYNVLDIDFDALNDLTTDEKLLAINNYCALLSGTKQNEYTGMLKDYNLIVICAESFSTAAIHPEVTPTLYKLSKEGFVFTNYFNSFPNTTTDGEYALMQGLWPDSSRGKASSSMYASRRSYLPFTLGNLFRDQRQIESFGYHNYEGSYYGRKYSHPNMGYSMKFMNDGMTFSSCWPASDLEMMEQSVDDYIGLEQFHAYYMTFSGHYQYSTKTNIIAQRNWEEVKNLPYASHAELAYLSCNLELEKALSYLMERLEEAGVADKTAIVLAGDHFPYGLTEEEYSDLIGYEIDDFTKFRSSLIFWVGGMREAVEVDRYCCNVDILPTILNLWGFEYDSRLLAGTDVFSDSDHTAILVNRSWMNDKVWFHSGTGEIRYLVPEEELPEGYVEQMNRVIETRFAISSDILNRAYYDFAFHGEIVYTDRTNWG